MTGIIEAHLQFKSLTDLQNCLEFPVMLYVIVFILELGYNRIN